jgi:hypothetical protein
MLGLSRSSADRPHVEANVVPTGSGAMALVATNALYLTKGLVMASPVAVLEGISHHKAEQHCVLLKGA